MNNSPINSTINSTTVVELADASSLMLNAKSSSQQVQTAEVLDKPQLLPFILLP